MLFAPHYSSERALHSTLRTYAQLVVPDNPVESSGLSNMPKRRAETELNGSNGHGNGNRATRELNGDALKGLGGTTDLPPTDEVHTKQNAWSGPGPAAFDFRSVFPINLFLQKNRK